MCVRCIFWFFVLRRIVVVALCSLHTTGWKLALIHYVKLEFVSVPPVS